jgi:hypothetical protein
LSAGVSFFSLFISAFLIQRLASRWSDQAHFTPDERRRPPGDPAWPGCTRRIGQGRTQAELLLSRITEFVWATRFGLRGGLPAWRRHTSHAVGWAALMVALIGGFMRWRYHKRHEESLLAKAEREMERQHRR